MRRQLALGGPALAALALLALGLLELLSRHASPAALQPALRAAAPQPAPPPSLRGPPQPPPLREPQPQPLLPPPLPWPPLPASTRRLTAASAPAPPAWCAGLRTAPTLTPAERALAHAHLAAAAARGLDYFEWGAGSSTLAAAAAGVARVTTVDTVAGALACVLVQGGLAEALGEARLAALHVEVHGEAGAFGNPVDEGARAAWPDVSGAILLHPAPRAIGVALVDGRFRAACILKAASVLRDDAVILVHDWDTRPAYHGGVAAGLLAVVAQAERLVALQRTAAAGALSREQWAEHWARVEYEQS
jgi:hypothetical protein